MKVEWVVVGYDKQEIIPWSRKAPIGSDPWLLEFKDILEEGAVKVFLSHVVVSLIQSNTICKQEVRTY